MTTQERFDERLAGWLREEARYRIPDHLDEVLVRTVATPQRSRWSSLERWLPVDLTTRATTLAPPRDIRLLLAAGLVIVLVASAILAVGSTRPRPAPPFGLARNGAIVFASSGDIYRVDAIDAAPRAIVAGGAVDASPLLWRDGTRLAFLRETGGTGGDVAIMVAGSDGSDIRELTRLSEPPWCADVAPDGSVIALCTTIDGVRGVYLLRTDRADVPRRLDNPVHDVVWLAWRPPDGSELIYLDHHSENLALWGVRRDGTGRHLITNVVVADPTTIGQLEPSLSSDGRSLVYAAVEDGVFRNHLVDLATGEDRALSLGPAGGHELHGILSPDGTKLLFHYADGRTQVIQEMLAPLDGSAPAIAIGPPFPIIDGSAELSQAFSPDGRSIVIYSGHERVVRVVDATTGGDGQRSTWETGELPAWQRSAP